MSLLQPVGLRVFVFDQAASTRHRLELPARSTLYDRSNIRHQLVLTAGTEVHYCSIS